MSGRTKSKKELEEEKKKVDQAAAAQAYVEFMATFDDNSTQSKDKVWVKAGTFDAGSKKEDFKEKGKLYKPTSKLQELAQHFSSAEKAAQYKPEKSDKPDKPGKKKEKDKKKTNLELFKEELRILQEERAERHRLKSIHQARDSDGKSTRFDSPESKLSSILGADDYAPGSFDSGDPNTTNIYLGNLSPKITEQSLMELFGRHGPLASIKIMWPRTDNEKSRGRNCGFVAFMNRKDGERAMSNLNGKDIDGFEMRLGWGKAVPIPSHPIYIPPSLMELTLPPPPSGLPFNAQPNRRDLNRIPEVDVNHGLGEEEKKVMDEILQHAVVKVVVPTERALLQLIHRTIEFVVREGPMFEAMVMNREISNPCYRFLFENQSPAHVYYRWKLFSILQGESTSRWCTDPFRMFRGGSIWKPPPLNPFLQGMPEELVRQNEEEEEINKRGSLSDAQRIRLEHIIRHLLPEKEMVGEAMVWCIEHAEAATEICTCICESLNQDHTSMTKKIARLYLVSDILHNCSVKVTNASFYRKGLQHKLQEIFEGLHRAHGLLESRIKAENVKQKVLQCIRVWEDWAVYTPEFLISLQNIFLGLINRSANNGMDIGEPKAEERKPFEEKVDNFDGMPLEDVDGVPMDKLDGFDSSKAANTPLLKSSAAISALQGYSDDEEDVDGAPMIDDMDGEAIESMNRANALKAPGFVSTKWESVSPQRVEAQAMTISKWDTLEAHQTNSNADTAESDATPVYEKIDDDDIDGIPIEYEDYRRKKVAESSDEEENEEEMEKLRGEVEEEMSNRLPGEVSEERRARLREVEVRVMQYQDELEQGIRSLKPGYTVARQVEHYRHKLLRKIEKGEAAIAPPTGTTPNHHALDTPGGRSRRGGSSRSHRRSRSISPHSSQRKENSRKRSRSPHKSRHRSRSPSSRSRHSRQSSPKRRRTHSRSPSRKHKKKRH